MRERIGTGRSATLETQRGEYCLLEVALPGRPAECAGVLLCDPQSDGLHFQLRRDWDRIADQDDAEVLEALEDDLALKAREWGASRCLEFFEGALSNVLRIGERNAVLVEDFGRALRRLYREHVRTEVLPFRTHLPFYTLRAAAGHWGEGMEVEPDGFVEILDDMRLSENLFVATVTGRSMEPKIPEGSRCVFRAGVAGSRNGRDVLIEHFGLSENQGRYTIKRYWSEKRATEQGWEHTLIRLEPLNPEYEAWHLDPGEFRVIAEFVRVVD